MTNKIISMTFFVLLLLSCLFTAVNFASGQSGLVVFITSDTTWGKVNSPYSLTGPTVVSPNVILTIDSGVTVNLNGYTLYVNGTLRALGSANDRIHINGYNITFGDSASSLSRFENSIINASLVSSRPITFSNSIIYNTITVADSATFSGCTILSSLYATTSTSLLNNEITGDVTVGDSATISGNSITGDVNAGKLATISGNTINGSKRITAPFGGYSYTIAVTVGNSSQVLHNTILGGLSATASRISDNTISGGAQFTDWAGRSEDATSALTVSGISYVTSNAIYSTTGGYGLLIRAGNTIVTGNTIRNMLRVAGNAVIDGNFFDGSGIQVGDIYIQAFNEIDYGSGYSTIKNNIINGGYAGISSRYTGGTAVIENNLIRDTIYGINLCSQATIQKNTIINSSTAIALKNTSPLINNNNIISYKENSIFLLENPSNINATYNWWGTTDSQAIGLSIHDSKYDLNLGSVNIQPILTSLNLDAPATSYTLQVPSIPSNSNPTPNPTNPSTTYNTPSQNPSITPTPSIPEYMPLTLFGIFVLGSIVATVVIRIKKQ